MDETANERAEQTMEETVDETLGQHAGPLAAGRHPVNVGHLVMGVAFAGLLVVWALVTGDAVEPGDIRVLLPVPWVAAGLAGLVGLVAAERRRARRAGHPR